MILLLSILFVLSLSFFLCYNYHIVLRHYWYWIICLFMIVTMFCCYHVQVLSYNVRKVNALFMKKVDQSLSDLESERVGLLNTLVVGGERSGVTCSM